MSASDHELLSILFEMVCAVVVGDFDKKYSVAWGAVIFFGRSVKFSVTAVWLLCFVRKAQTTLGVEFMRLLDESARVLYHAGVKTQRPEASQHWQDCVV